MRRRIVDIVLQLIFPIVSISQNADLKGLKKLIVTEKIYHKGVLINGPVTTMEYDKNGNLLRSSQKLNGDTIEARSIVYASSGKVKEYTFINQPTMANQYGIYGPAGYGLTVTKFWSEYDEKGNEIKNTRTERNPYGKVDTMVSYTKFTFDKNDSITSIKSSMTEKGHCEAPVYYSYGPFGVTRKAEYYNGETDSVAKTLEYDTKGELVKMKEIKTVLGFRSDMEVFYYTGQNGIKRSKEIAYQYDGSIQSIRFLTGSRCDSALYYENNKVSSRFIREKDPTDTIKLFYLFHGLDIGGDDAVNRRYKFNKQGQLTMYYSKQLNEGTGLIFEYNGNLMSKRKTYRGLWNDKKPMELRKPDSLVEFTY